MTRNIRLAPGEAPDPGGRKLKFVDGSAVVLFNVDGVVHAIDDSCPHKGASLLNGRLDGHVLQCPAHGLRFDIVSGCVVGAPGICLRRLAVDTSQGSLIDEDIGT
jgi:3-phenylpropionate/trans-cinnamate dioxygenase ferredoxin component